MSPVRTRHSLTGPSPVDRGKAGSEIHVLSDRAGLPLSVAVSAANTNDSYALKPLIRPSPRSHPGVVRADANPASPVPLAVRSDCPSGGQVAGWFDAASTKPADEVVGVRAGAPGRVEWCGRFPFVRTRGRPHRTVQSGRSGVPDRTSKRGDALSVGCALHDAGQKPRSGRFGVHVRVRLHAQRPSRVLAPGQRDVPSRNRSSTAM